MSKQLLVMRHAKSSWNDLSLGDFQRPLNERGLRDTPQMAQFVNRQNCFPKLIASSTALRARQTAEVFAKYGPAPDRVQLELVDDFYHAPPQAYLQYLIQLNQHSPDSVMVVGHNPGLEELVGRLSGRSLHFPTAAIASFTFEVDDWSEISPANCQLNAIWCPKEVL
jgi:phosphohistidine phosphatase